LDFFETNFPDLGNIGRMVMATKNRPNSNSGSNGSIQPSIPPWYGQLPACLAASE